MSVNIEKLKSINVVIVGGVHHNTLGVIRSLGEERISRENIHVLLIGESISNQNIISSSRYVVKKNVIILQSYDEVVGSLQELAKDGVKRVVISCSDGASEVVISNKDKLSDGYFIPSTRIDIGFLMQKDVQDSIASSCGLHVPKSIVITQDDNYEWNYYPCISKPLKSILGAGKNDICIASTEKELKSILGKLEASTVQIQEFIEKKQEIQLIGCSLNDGEIVIIPGYTNILRQPKNTNTGYLEYIPIENLEYDSKAVENFIKKIGYNGLFSIEFIRDKNAKDYFLEINMRNDGNAYCVTSAGINLPFIWCYYCVYRQVPNLPIRFNKVIRFIPDFNDLKVALLQKCFFRWIFDFLGADAHSIYNRRDYKPFFVEIINQMKRHF